MLEERVDDGRVFLVLDEEDAVDPALLQLEQVVQAFLAPADAEAVLEAPVVADVEQCPVALAVVEEGEHVPQQHVSL